MGRGPESMMKRRMRMRMKGLLFLVLLIGAHGQMQGTEEKNYYELLSLTPDASETEVKKAYRKLAQVYHPDKNPSDKEAAASKFAEVAEAYEVLGNAETRREYDQYLRESRMASHARQAEPATAGAWPFFSERGHWRDPFDVFEEMFADYVYRAANARGDYRADWEDEVVYEEEERYHVKGREYVRLQRVYADGRTEVVTREVGQHPPRSQQHHYHEQPSRTAAPPTRGSSRFEVPEQLHTQRRYELRSGERLEVNDVLLSRNGNYVAHIDHVRGTLVVEEKGEVGGRMWDGWGRDTGEQVVWESPPSAPPSRGHEMDARFFLALRPRGRLELVRVATGGQQAVVVWASRDEGVAEDWSLPHRYVATVDEDGNLVVFSETGIERECLWASLGCNDDGFDALMLRRMKKRVVPFIRGCGRFFCAVRDRLLVTLPKMTTVKPQIRRGVQRLQDLMRKTAKKVVGDLYRRLTSTTTTTPSES